ncbi:E3 ubiquitin-protein ligase RNF13 [Bacillus rossius redtenbacheri]|uniref:E3 ubiquitin-protein ligase RNF13 n=1 Tax=Bacillus rossius redtenbacheri TaxID=93214 RepID=UPI002FDD521B
MYPQCPLPRHVTALYVVSVVSCVALFSRHSALVGAEVLVFRKDYYHEAEMQFPDLPARFGDSLPEEGLKGLVKEVHPLNGCSNMTPAPLATSNSAWIALIRRYGCSFEQKVRNAQFANYSAAIVYNINSSDLEQMSAKNPEGIYIPSVFVNDEAGFVITERYLWNHGYYVIINDDLPFNINTHLLLPFAIVVGLCFLIMVIFMVVKFIKDRRRQQRHRLPSSSLKKIPTSKFSKSDPYETCAICLEDYQEGEKLRILPCSHAYHCKCIDPWLTKNRRVCPVCKRRVFAHDEHVSDTDSDSEADDTTPLVRSESGGTQGGTFQPQRENPFTRASNEQAAQSVSSVSSSESEHIPSTTAAPSLSVQERLLQSLWASLYSSSSSSSSSTCDSHYETPAGTHQETFGAEDEAVRVGVAPSEHSINSSSSHIALMGSQEEAGSSAAPEDRALDLVV